MFKAIADNNNPNSLASRSRSKRFEFFKSELNKLPRPLKILDIGGTQEFWEMMGFVNEAGVEIYLLNLEKTPVSYPNFKSLKGDARDLSEFEDGSFDVVFSNSVIEHLFTWENQVKMAQEMIRVGKNHFVQTPNFWFPIEPHFVFPFFQFLPLAVRERLVHHFNLGHHKKYPDMKVAREIVREVKLLSKNEFKKLFPDFNFYDDKFMGLNKSFVAYKFNENLFD